MLDHHVVGGTIMVCSTRFGISFFFTGHKTVDLCLQKQIQILQQAHVHIRTSTRSLHIFVNILAYIWINTFNFYTLLLTSSFFTYIWVWARDLRFDVAINVHLTIGIFNLERSNIWLNWSSQDHLKTTWQVDTISITWSRTQRSEKKKKGSKSLHQGYSKERNYNRTATDK